MKQHLSTLTSIRFFAAIWVLAFHYDLYGYRAPGFLHAIATCGAEGVTLFFVLSGFILAYTYNARLIEGRYKTGEFLLARVARVYPLYLFSLALGVVQQLSWPSPEGAGMLVTEPVKAVAMNLALVQNWNPQARGAINGPGWSIACEAAFYLAFPLLAMLAIRTKRSGLLALIASVAAFSVFAKILATNGLLELWMPPRGVGAPLVLTIAHGSLWLPFARFHEFMLGVIAFRSLNESSLRGLLLGTLFGAVVALSLTLGIAPLLKGTHLPSSGLPTYVPSAISSLLPYLFAALILVLAKLGGERPKALAHPWLIFGGKISFATYLVHMPIFCAAVGVMTALRHGGHLLVPIAVGMTLLVATAAFRWIEEPGRRAILSVSKRRVRDEGPIPAAP